jgi:hypothetical protein
MQNSRVYLTRFAENVREMSKGLFSGVEPAVVTVIFLLLI